MVRIHSTTPEKEEDLYFKIKDANYNLRENLRKLSQIEKLDENWNGNGAKLIRKEVIQETKRILKSLDKDKFPLPFIAPTSQSIQLEWDYDCYYLEIEVESGNELKIFIADQENVEKGFPLSLSGTIRNDRDLKYIKRLLRMFYRNKSS